MAIQEVKVAHTSKRANGDQLVVQLQLVNGKPNVDVRAWYGDDENGYAAGRKGISLTLAEFEALKKLVVKATDFPAETEATKVVGRKF